MTPDAAREVARIHAEVAVAYATFGHIADRAEFVAAVKGHEHESLLLRLFNHEDITAAIKNAVYAQDRI